MLGPKDEVLGPHELNRALLGAQREDVAAEAVRLIDFAANGVDVRDVRFEAAVA